jgi:uncharacterized protein
VSPSLEVVSFFVSLLAGGVAGVAGFGLGGILTPFYVPILGTKVAIAFVAIPHIAATAVRLWLLRRNIDRRLLVEFGIPSAVGGLAGAFLHTLTGSAVLTVVLASLLVFVGLSGLSGLAERFRLRGRSATIAGAISGALGGFVGNQGGIRSAALLGTGVQRDAFIATSTAVGLLVDLVRVPVYAAGEWGALRELGRPLLIATAGAIAGTFAGRALLGRLNERVFRRTVSALILLLGLYLFTTLGTA